MSLFTFSGILSREFRHTRGRYEAGHRRHHADHNQHQSPESRSAIIGGHYGRGPQNKN